MVELFGHCFCQEWRNGVSYLTIDGGFRADKKIAVREALDGCQFSACHASFAVWMGEYDNPASLIPSPGNGGCWFIGIDGAMADVAVEVQFVHGTLMVEEVVLDGRIRIFGQSFSDGDPFRSILHKSIFRVCLCREMILEINVVPDTDDENALSFLRNTIICRIEQFIGYCVSQFGEIVENHLEYLASRKREDAFHILR